MLHNIISNLSGTCNRSANGGQWQKDQASREKQDGSLKEEGDDSSGSFQEPTNLFRLPIYYNKLKCSVSEEIITELELEKVYAVVCPVTNTHDCVVLKDLSETYTTDVKYLQETQELVTKYKSSGHSTEGNQSSGHSTERNQSSGHSTEGNQSSGHSTERNQSSGHSTEGLEPAATDSHYDTVIELEKELQIDQLLSKYGLIDYEHFEFLNNLENVLQAMTMYVLISPLLTLATPVIIFILPFFILQLRYNHLTWELYVTILKDIGKSNPLIRMLTHYGESSAEQKTYQILTFSFYLFSIYQQLSYCFKFYENFVTLHRYLIGLRTYLERTIQNMRHLISFTHELRTYKSFNTDLSRNINELMDLIHLLSPITAFEWSVSKFMQMGYVLKTFYTLKTTPSIMENVTYALHFNSYFRHMETLASLYTAKKIYCAKLLKDKTPTLKLKGMYYPALVGADTYDSVVKNSVTLQKNLILTGPNASGKTTTIKAIFLNVLLTQQFGVGCYNGASLTPFKHLHCYLNIPDTMGRDSLFQAEARRCKKMIDDISANSHGKHLCMFDELFSGTNPEEAVTSSERFIRYITKQPNVKWVLTTHFNKLCKSLDKDKEIQNCHMEVSEDFVASYKLKKNISNVKGAFKILSDMNFPKEITQ
jgi:hypothetical protein